MARVLLVDEETDFRAMIRRALEEGHVVDEVAAGAEGLARLQQATYDLVVTELYLPDMTGLVLLAAARSMSSAPPPMIIVTALGDWGTYARALELGVTAYLTKPLRIAELSRQVARALSACRSLRGQGVSSKEGTA